MTADLEFVNLVVVALVAGLGVGLAARAAGWVDSP
jgi:hypothetical protein